MAPLELENQKEKMIIQNNNDIMKEVKDGNLQKKKSKKNRKIIKDLGDESQAQESGKQLIISEFTTQRQSIDLENQNTKPSRNMEKKEDLKNEVSTMQLP